ncbi:MAG TPA: hypothetical protein VKA01_14535 [Vicinamibacteria bacterium]|nr:hypothetical protein [Vicinamibacteria bacterium]
MQACLFASTGPFELRAGDAATVDLVLVSSRQEWGVGYTFQAF